MKRPLVVIGKLDEDERGEVIIRGTISKDMINLLQSASYQRSANFSPAKTRRLIQAIKTGSIRRFPDIILGMRGHRWDSVEDGFTLKDPVFIIDGVQRCFAWAYASSDDPDKDYRMGCKVYINTTQDGEIAMVRELNTGHTAMAPSVLLRNEKDHSRVAAMLFGLSHQDSFALKNRVCWDQVMNKSVNGDLVRGSTLLQVLLALQAHNFIGADWGSAAGTKGVIANLAAVDNQIDAVGLQNARDNLLGFFDVIDAAWGIRSVIDARSPTHLTRGWLLVLARVFSSHTDFWKDNDRKFFMAAAFLRDLRERIDPQEEELDRLAKGNATSRDILYEYIVKRLNKGKVTNRIKERRERQRREEGTDQPGARP
jgi:hypothetical protein